MEKSIINRRGEYLVVVDVAGTPRDKYSHPAGTWECAMTLADGSPQIIRGAYADGPVMQSIRPDEQAQWAVVGSVSDDKFTNILKLLATSKTNAAAALGSISTPKKAASSRENGKLGGRPRTKTWTFDTYNITAKLSPEGLILENWNCNQDFVSSRKILIVGATEMPNDNNIEYFTDILNHGRDGMENGMEIRVIHTGAKVL